MIIEKTSYIFILPALDGAHPTLFLKKDDNGFGFTENFKECVRASNYATAKSLLRMYEDDYDVRQVNETKYSCTGRDLIITPLKETYQW